MIKSTIVVLSASPAELSMLDIQPLYAASEVIIVQNDNKRYGGLGTVANRVLDRCDANVFGIVHADTTFGSKADVSVFLNAAQKHVTGLVGRAPLPDGKYIWSKDITTQHEVSTLDSCSLFFPTSSGIRFDTSTFDDFHMCVEDVCLLGRSKGLSVVVPPAKANHRGTRAYHPVDKHSWYQSYWMYYRRFKAKWAALPTVTTGDP